MRAPGSWSLLLAASFTSGLALGAPSEPSAAAAPSAAATPSAEPAPPSPPASPESPPAATSGQGTGATTASAPQAAPDTAATPATTGVAAAEARAEETKPVGQSPAPVEQEPPSDFHRDFSALPLSLEARFGFNARLGSSFDDAADEEHWGASYAFASYLSWRPEFALGLELDHSGLGQVRALTGQTSVDNGYTATGAWLGARVFPIRRERLDFFVNLRVGMVWQHVDALGTRGNDMSITEPAQSFACTESDGPGIGLGGGIGLAYRLGRHFAFVSRLDLNGLKLSGETLGTCADGIGSVATLGGSVGLAFEFETAPK
ncbi:MAG TPA: hypothetical protein VFK05_14705 [Polyangiaceae bacterium]|nr:hypothetical protein [Polyangiaceae bacterium]